jgi:hypothetical protein
MGRPEVRAFPPQGPDPGETFFARLDKQGDGRLYLGIAATGRAFRATLARVYQTVMGAAQKHYDAAGGKDQGADAYMTLVGYFNALRELGAMRRVRPITCRGGARAEHERVLQWRGDTAGRARRVRSARSVHRPHAQAARGHAQRGPRTEGARRGPVQCRVRALAATPPPVPAMAASLRAPGRELLGAPRLALCAVIDSRSRI